MRKADNLPPSCAVVTKSGNLNFMEPSGPVQACNGTVLPECERKDKLYSTLGYDKLCVLNFIWKSSRIKRFGRMGR